LEADLKRYRALRRQITDQQILVVIEQFISEIEARLAAIASKPVLIVISTDR
jgi:hypothetical protein